MKKKLAMMLAFLIMSTMNIYAQENLDGGGCVGITKKTPDELKSDLEAGNLRFQNGNLTHNYHIDATHREKLRIDGQCPQVAVIGCSDSRVPPELLFDQGIGDLFNMRVAGNYFGTEEIQSALYATEHFQTPLILVLGHRHCGAMEAVIRHFEDGKPKAKLSELLQPLYDVVRKAKEDKPNFVGVAFRRLCEKRNVYNSMKYFLGYTYWHRNDKDPNNPNINGPNNTEKTYNALKSGSSEVKGAIYRIGAKADIEMWLDGNKKLSCYDELLNYGTCKGIVFGK